MVRVDMPSGKNLGLDLERDGRARLEHAAELEVSILTTSEGFGSSSPARSLPAAMRAAWSSRSSRQEWPIRRATNKLRRRGHDWSSAV